MFQEQFAREPFWMLVGCCLLNRASWRTASPVHAELRRRWPYPANLAAADVREVEKVVVPAGFGSVRAPRLVALAREWVARPPRTATDVLELPGCGRYAADSFAIFVEGRMDVVPTDGHLVLYLARKKSSDSCLFFSQPSLYGSGRHVQSREEILMTSVEPRPHACAVVSWCGWIEDPRVERAATRDAAEDHVRKMPDDRTAHVVPIGYVDEPWNWLEGFAVKRLVELYIAFGGDPIPSGRFETRGAGVARVRQLIERLTHGAHVIQPREEKAKMSETQVQGTNETKQRKFKPAKVGEFKPVRAGSKLARHLEALLMGGRTVDSMIGFEGLREYKDVSFLLRRSLADLHGIGHRIDKDGVITIVPPRGKCADDLIKTTSESKREPVKNEEEAEAIAR